MTTIINPPPQPTTTMVETDSSGSAVAGTIIGIALVAAIGYGIYAFSHGSSTVIEHNTDTTNTIDHTISVPTPVPTPEPAAPAPAPAAPAAPSADQ